MVKLVRRHFWVERIEQAWKKHSLIWLSGVRRTRKTTLAAVDEQCVQPVDAYRALAGGFNSMPVMQPG